jgi:hypothetical protein
MAISAEELELDPPQPPEIVAAIARLLSEAARHAREIEPGRLPQRSTAGVPRKSRGTERA